MKGTLYETVTRTIIDALEAGVVPWRKPWGGEGAMPCNALTQRRYRGINTFLLSVAPYCDHRWLTFNQAKERGGRVKAGEKATLVVFWKQWLPPKPETESTTDKPRTIPVLKHFFVFNVEQIETLDVPPLYEPKPEAELERIARAEQLVASMPNLPRLQEGRSAWYRPTEDLVQVPPLQRFTSADSYYATLYHELAHATGHPDRLNRSGVTGDIQFGSGDYSREELVAELASAFCCATVALDNSLLADAASYIQGWLSILKADPKAVVIAAAQAQRAADYIKGVTYGPQL